MAATIQVPTIFTAKDGGFNSTVGRMSKKIQGFANKSIFHLKRLDSRINKMFARLKSFVGNFGLFLGGTALFMGISHGIGVVADFEQANANLASIMTKATVPQLKAMQEQAILLGSTTAKTATEVVGLQEALARLGFETPDILNMTEGVISASIAMRGDLAETAEMVGAVIRTFDSFDTTNTVGIVDKLTLSTQKSALNFEKLQTALPIVAGAANAAGIDFETLLSLLGKLSDAGIDASMSSTALRNIFIESKSKGLDYAQTLQLISRNSDKLTASVDAFGRRAAVSGAILSNKLQEIGVLTDELKNNFDGTAKSAEKIQLNTIRGRLTLLTSAYEGFLLSLDSGNGKLSEFIKNVLEVSTVLLTMWSGGKLVTEGLTEQQEKIIGWAKKAEKWLKVIGYVIGAIIALKVAILAFGAVAAVFETVSLAIGVFEAVSFIAAATGMTFAGALWAIFWPIGLVAAAIAAIVAIYIYWDEITNFLIETYNEFGQVLTLLLGPIGWVINAIITLGNHWSDIKTSFSQEGVISGFKAIGNAIIDFMLTPLEQFTRLLSYVPGIGKFATKGVQVINDYRSDLGFDSSGLTDQVISKERSIEESIVNNNTKQSFDFNIKDPGKWLDNVTDSDSGLPIMLSNTLSYGGDTN